MKDLKNEPIYNVITSDYNFSTQVSDQNFKNQEQKYYRKNIQIQEKNIISQQVISNFDSNHIFKLSPQTQVEHNLKMRLLEKTENLSKNYQPFKSVKIVKQNFQPMKKLLPSPQFSSTAPINFGYYQKNELNQNQIQQEKITIISPLNPKYTSNDKIESSEQDFTSNQMNSHIDRSPVRIERIVEESMTIEDPINPFDTIDSFLPKANNQRIVYSDRKIKENSIEELGRYRSVKDFEQAKIESRKSARKSILKKKKPGKGKQKKSVKFANISLVKKLRPEEIIQTPLSEVEGLYMPTVFYFKEWKPLKPTKLINFRSAKIALGSNKAVKKHRRKFKSNHVICSVDYTNQKDYSMRKGGYINIEKLKESSKKANSISGRGSFAADIDIKKNLKRKNMNSEVENGPVTDRVCVRKGLNPRNGIYSERKSRKSPGSSGKREVQDQPNFTDQTPPDVNQFQDTEEEIQLIEHQSVVFNYVENQSLKKLSKKSSEKVKIKKKSVKQFSGSSGNLKKISNPSTDRKSFHNFLSCFDIQDSELKRNSVSLKRRSIERHRPSLKNKISDFEKRLETKIAQDDNRNEKSKLSKPVEDILSKIKKFKQEHYKSKSRGGKEAHASKYLKVIKSKFKDGNFRSSLSPARKIIQKDFEQKKRKEKSSNVKKRRTLNLRLKSKSRQKYIFSKTNKSFEPRKRMKIEKKIWNRKKKSKSPKSIIQKLTT